MSRLISPRGLLRSTLILLFLSAVGLLAYASSGILWPTTLTVNPSGTLSGAISAISSDPTNGADNTAQLGGLGLDSYVLAGAGQAVDCGSTQYLVGVDANRTLKCGTKGATLLVLAVIYESSPSGVMVNGVTKPVGTPIYAGDTIQTTAGGTGSLLFPDDSIVRLDSSTQLALNSSTDVTLQGGSLWARVLGTNGGWNLATDEVAVGVQGTALSMSRASGQTQTLIIDSSDPDGLAVATVKCKVKKREQDPKELDRGSDNLIITDKNGCTTKSRESKEKKLAYLDSPFIRSSQIADIDYLSTLSQNNPTSLATIYPSAVLGKFTTNAGVSNTTNLLAPRPTPRQEKVRAELAVSDPTDADDTTKENICGGSSTGKKWWNKDFKCQDAGVVAMASDKTNGKLVRNDGTIFSLSGGSVGLESKIEANEYLAYSLPAGVPDWGWLKGMKVEITVDDGIVTPTSSSILKMVFDGGVNSRALMASSGNWYCTWDGSQKLCSNTSSINLSPGNKVITITIPSINTPSQFVVGNHLGHLSDYFIDRKVKKIRVLRP